MLVMTALQVLGFKEKGIGLQETGLLVGSWID